MKSSKDVASLTALRSTVMNRRAEALLPLIQAGKESYNQSLRTIRRELFKKNPAARLLKVSGNLLYFAAPKLEGIPKLPKGYGFKGGVARLALKSILGNKVSKDRPRDIDLIRIGTTPNSRDEEIAQTLMAEDYIYGNGVELVSTLESYFETRDLSINEALLLDKTFICTEQAFNDASANILRPVRAIREGARELETITVAKMFRLYAEARAIGDVPQIQGLPLPVEIPKFQVELQLKRVSKKAKPILEEIFRQFGLI